MPRSKALNLNPRRYFSSWIQTPDAAHQRRLEKAAELIEEAERPVILAGHGVLMSGAMEELRIFAVKDANPGCDDAAGAWAHPASFPSLVLGMMGMHGEAYCNLAIQNADLLLAFGMRFDDRVTGNLRTYAPTRRKIHIEIDPSEVHKNVMWMFP